MLKYVSTAAIISPFVWALAAGINYAIFWHTDFMGFFAGTLLFSCILGVSVSTLAIDMWSSRNAEQLDK